MAFSFRKIFSNITYFKKPEETRDIFKEFNDDHPKKSSQNKSVLTNLERRGSDCGSHLCTSLKLPNSIKAIADKKGSLSDTDLIKAKTANGASNGLKREKRRKCKKLKLDIKKASESLHELSDDSFNIENTPKHILLDHSDEFGDRFKGFDFNKSFDLYDELSDDRPSSPFDEEINLDSYSEGSDSDISIPVDSPIKMCRKVEANQISKGENHIPSAPISFETLDLDKSEEERLKIILNYQLKLEEIDGLIKNLLNEYHYQIEVSKNLKAKSMSSFNGDYYSNKVSSDYIDDKMPPRYPSPGESWDMVMHREEDMMKYKLKKQLWSMKSYIEQFVQEKFQNYKQNKKCAPLNRNTTFNGQRQLSYKKKMKYYDFPDIRDAMLNLFIDKEYDNNLCEFDESDTLKCSCKCHAHSENDSDMEKAEQSFSITSSIGNFSLDISTLTAYSESLDQNISYNSFEESSLYHKLLQKAAVDRITFYVQTHSIELTSEPYDVDFESRNMVTFNCVPCKYMGTDEYGLLEHILSQSHCEKIHFLYKTAYIKKCVAAGKEIQPSTVLNPMKMYRDDNKIVCFGDAVYACTLCFENSIVGESVLMAHCSDPVHVENRHSFEDMLD